MLADGNQLRQALLNVLRNAVEAGAKQLRLSVTADDDEVRLELADDGPGMSAEEAEFFEQIRPTSLIKRFATPQEVASLVAYVASPLASATTGAALRVDGGVVKSAF